MAAVSLRPLFAAMDAALAEQRRTKETRQTAAGVARTALDRHMRLQMQKQGEESKMNGFKRMQLVRDALCAMDRQVAWALFSLPESA